MNNLFENIKSSSWHPRRFIGLALGLFLGYQAFEMQDVFPALLASFFLFQAVTNTGCFGAAGCAVPEPEQSSKINNPDKVEYTEIN